MNKVILMGRLTADPELRYTPNGVSVTQFSVAVNRRFTKDGQQKADFINCVAWRQTAEFVCKYFYKGSMIALSGSIQSRSWDGADGKKQHATEVIAEDVYFTGSKEESKPTYKTGYPATSQQQPKQVHFNDLDDTGFSAFDGSIEDLPF